MFGAIIGDTIGSAYEWHRTKQMDFPLFTKGTKFTDDTVLTIATAYVLLNDNETYAGAYKDFANAFPGRGYGGSFGTWIKSSSMEPYNSWGNGSAMRVSPVGFAFNSEKEVLDEAKKSAECTHNHIEGIKGAQATALAIYYAKVGLKKETIRTVLAEMFDYNLKRTVDEIRPTYSFKVSCQESVPEAIIAFLDSTDFENAIRLAVSLGGDSDTLACITGGIAEAYYKEIPEEMIKLVWAKLHPKLQSIIMDFYKHKYKGRNESYLHSRYAWNT